MSALDRKLTRDLRRVWAQVLTISLVVACGVASFVAMRSTWSALAAAREDWYASSRFAHVFAPFRRGPSSLSRTLRALPGVTAAETRLVLPVRFDLPGDREPSSGLAVSIPDGAQGLHRLFVREGRLPDLSRPDEVVVSEAFARARRLAPGAALPVVIEGRRLSLRVCGVGLSPEFVYATPPGEFMPDDRRYGIVWMREGALSGAAGLRGLSNSALLTLGPGARLPEVLSAVDALLLPYGGVGAYGRERQPSDRFVWQKIEGLRAQSTVTPALFLAVAAFLVQVALGRLLATQREQIAALKALGYTRGELASHYGKLSLVVVTVGGLGGLGLGAWFGSAMIDLYQPYFRFPALRWSLDGAVFFQAVLACALAAFAGAGKAVYDAASLPPAEAMRPEAPPSYRATFFERLGAYRWFSAGSRMVLRDLERRPVRTLGAASGIAFAVAIGVVGRFSQDSVPVLMDLQFGRIQREDVTVNLYGTAPDRALRALSRVPGLRSAEPLRALAVELSAGSARRTLGLQGLDRGSTLHRLVDQGDRAHELPLDDIALSKVVADRLRVRAGDRVHVRTVDARGREGSLRVALVLDDVLGEGAWIDRRLLCAWLGEEPSWNAALVTVDPRAEAEVYLRLRAFPAVAGVARRDRMLRYFEDQMARTTLAVSLVLTAFASAVAVGVVYNTARVALAQRARDLATLRVLGLSRSEVSRMFLSEQAALLVLGIPLGLLLGRALTVLLAASIDQELFRLPMVLSVGTYAKAAGTVLGAGVASALWVRRRIDAMDLVSVLKARD